MLGCSMSGCGHSFLLHRTRLLAPLPRCPHPAIVRFAAGPASVSRARQTPRPPVQSEYGSVPRSAWDMVIVPAAAAQQYHRKSRQLVRERRMSMMRRQHISRQLRQRQDGGGDGSAYRVPHGPELPQCLLHRSVVVKPQIISPKAYQHTPMIQPPRRMWRRLLLGRLTALLLTKSAKDSTSISCTNFSISFPLLNIHLTPAAR